MTAAPQENRPKSRGVSRYALALIPLLVFVAWRRQPQGAQAPALAPSNP